MVRQPGPARVEGGPAGAQELAQLVAACRSVAVLQDKLEGVADGRSVALVPAYDRRCADRDDLAVVPVDGIEPCQVVVATRSGDRSPLVAGFREAAGRLLRPPQGEFSRF